MINNQNIIQGFSIMKLQKLQEMASSKVADPNYGLGNDAKGKLHEILVGHFLMHGTEHGHPSNFQPSNSSLPKFPERPSAGGVKEKKSRAIADTAAGLHDALKKRLSPENYNHHVRIAKFAAAGILKGLADEGHISAGNKGNSRITNVHWTSRPADIERLSGVADKANNADIVVKKRKKDNGTDLAVETNHGPANGGEHIGISLKIHNEKKESTLANPGRGTLDSTFHINTDNEEQKALEAAHHAAAHYGINTRVLAKKAAHDTIKKHAGIREIMKPATDDALHAITNKIRNRVAGLNPYHTANLLRKAANIKPTAMKLYKSATYGTHTLSHSFENPMVEMDAILKQHEGHVRVEPSKKKTTTVNFIGKNDPKTGKPTPIGKLSVKYGSSTPHTGIVGVLQGWSAGSKSSISPAAKEWAKRKHGYIPETFLVYKGRGQVMIENVVSRLFNSVSIKKKILNESSDEVNTHLTHVEDRVIDNGHKGVDLAVRTLYGVHDSLKGRNSSTRTTIKKDGAPAIFAGHKDGKFFVATKSLFNKNAKINFNHADIEANHGHAPGLVDKLKQAHTHLQKVIPNDGKIYQGDLMYGKGDVHDDGKHYAFKANTIRYSTPKASAEGAKIAKAKLGVALHTVYENGKAQFGFDSKHLPHHPDVHLISPIMHHHSSNASYTPEYQAAFTDAMKNVKQKAKEAKQSHDAVEPHRAHMNIYINSTVRDNTTPTAAGYGSWLHTRSVKEKKSKSLAQHAVENHDHIQKILNLHQSVSDAKHALLNVLDRHNHTYHHDIDGAPAKPEGYVAVDKNRASKLVNRKEFSRANFLAGGIKKSKEIKEDVSNHPVTAVYGKVRIPTIGHKLLVDAAKKHAKVNNHALNITLSGANNPLSLEDKKAHAEKLFRCKVNSADSNSTNVVQFLSHLHNQGHRELHLFAGSDRAEEYARILNRYNGKADKKGHVAFAFNKWQVHPVGAERTESDKHPTQMSKTELRSTVSASKLEQLAKAGDYEGFRAYHPGIHPNHVKTVYNKIREHK